MACWSNLVTRIAPRLTDKSSKTPLSVLQNVGDRTNWLGLGVRHWRQRMRGEVVMAGPGSNPSVVPWQ